MDEDTTKFSPWSWEATGALCCFSGGILAALLGSLLTAMTWILDGRAYPWLRGFGTGLLIVTIPLLILAGYCLDWMERKPKNSQQPSSPTHEAILIEPVEVQASAGTHEDALSNLSVLMSLSQPMTQDKHDH